MDRDSINKARTIYYGMFASLFAFSFNERHFSKITEAVDILVTNPLDDDSGEALMQMKTMLETSSFGDIKAESDMVFFSPTTSLVPMTASYYDEQRDDGKKRLDMMNFVLQSKFRRNTVVFKENEDHIEFISLFMQRLIEDELHGQEGSAGLARAVFENVINPMIDQLSEKLFCHEKSKLYRQAAIVLDSFAGFERLFFNLPRPAAQDQRNNVSANMKPRKIKKAPRKLVERNLDEFVSI